MRKYKMVPHDSIYLDFPIDRSDGNSERWPLDKLDPTPNAENEVNFMRPIGHDEPLSIKWRMQIGREVARLMGHANYAKYVLRDFPIRYKFYAHYEGPAGDPRTKPRLYGSAKFRSPQEFIPHAFWLMTDETLDRKNCGCKYCAMNKMQKHMNEEQNVKSASGHSSIHGPAHGMVKLRPVLQPRKTLSRNVTNHDRVADMRSTRRFRMGELVWCSLRPVICGSHPNEHIEYWPGLISETRLKNEVLPHAPGEQWRVIQSNEYKVKLLAVRHSLVLRETEMLPYQAYGAPHTLIDSLRKTGDPTLLQNLQLSDFNPTFVGKDPTGSSQMRFVEASTPFALAIQIAARFVRMWTPSEEWIFHGESPGLPSQTYSGNGLPIVGLTEVRYQGLWWGAERIWVDELVRLQPGRSQVIPQGSDVIHRASPRADSRGILMRINAIFAEQKGIQRDSVRECKVSGVLYELAEDTYEEDTENQAVHASKLPTSSVVTNRTVASVNIPSLKPENGKARASPIEKPPSSSYSPINIPSFSAYMPEPPAGCKFRRITKAGYEIILDVSFIAGRYYPGLLEHPLLQDALEDTEANDSRIAQRSALCGLSSGAMNSMECIDWVGTRLAMIKSADAKARTDLHRHWHASPLEETSQN